jgi:hypothetical protein
VRKSVGDVEDNADVKVFISSLITGFEPLRDAAATAITALGHEVVRAEDFPASGASPQSACLAGVRASDVVALILGDRYGYEQASGLSATHEEYREARDSRTVLVFVQGGVSPDSQQAELIREVQGWEQGHFTASFTDADELRDCVTRALHDFTLATEAAPLNETELVERAQQLIPARHQSNRAALLVAVAPGPTRAVLRPAELEAAALHHFVLAESLTGDYAVLTAAAGTDQGFRGDALELRQQQAERLVRLDESGRILVVQPAMEHDRGSSGIPSIIEEHVATSIERTFRFTARLLEYVDPVNRLTHVAPVVALLGAGYQPWRTRDEQQRSPNRATMGTSSSEESVVLLTPPVRRRAALIHDAARLAEDFTVRLRREIRR